MKSLWEQSTAAEYLLDPLGMRVYTSRLLTCGASESNVHDGTNVHLT